jgi:hypothetical protein
MGTEAAQFVAHEVHDRALGEMRGLAIEKLLQRSEAAQLRLGQENLEKGQHRRLKPSTLVE